jgi:uncharacterized membrane protein (UPF0127 family)
LPSTTLRAGDTVLRLAVARTDQERRDIRAADGAAITPGAGRLYDGVDIAAWDTDGYPAAVDLIWVDASKRIVAIIADVPPNAHSSAERDLAPSDDTRYAIELDAGSASELGLAPGAQLSFFPATTMAADGVRINAEVACTLDDQLEIGLVSRPALDEDSALLYNWQQVLEEFPNIKVWSTQGYEFPIDIIWLDATKTVISAMPDVAPDTTNIPQAEGMHFAIEANAGAAERWGLSPGSELSFDVPC